MRKLPLPKLPTVLDEGWDEDASDKLIREWRIQCGLKLMAESVGKLSLLLQHYDIVEKGDERWFYLAFELARDFVPGFAIDERKLPGRSKLWDYKRLCLLWLDVQILIQNKQHSVASACTVLAKRREWQPPSDSKPPSNRIPRIASTLRQRYESEASKSDLMPMMKRMVEDKGIERAREIFYANFFTSESTEVVAAGASPPARSRK